MPIDGSQLEEERLALRESIEVYRMLIEQTGDGVIVVEGASLRVVDANESACALLGYSRAELLDMRSSDLVPPEDVPLLVGAGASVDAG